MNQELLLNSSSKKKKSAEKPITKVNQIKSAVNGRYHPIKTGILFSENQKKAIAIMAFDISKENKPYDVYIWLYSELYLALLYKNQPSEHEIRDFAAKLAYQKPPVQDLHWGIAEMRLQMQTKG